jgi:hypothetical protein
MSYGGIGRIPDHWLPWAQGVIERESQAGERAAEEQLADMRCELIQAGWAWDVGDDEGAEMHMAEAVACLECAIDEMRE